MYKLLFIGLFVANSIYSQNIIQGDSFHLIKGKIVEIESKGRYAFKVTIKDSSQIKSLLWCDTHKTSCSWAELKKGKSITAYGKYFEMGNTKYLMPTTLKITE